MRYYLYVSDAKIDMLFEQIPQRLLKRLTKELKVDVKVISFTVKERVQDDTRFGRLNVVESYLWESFDVGSASDPATWFEDSLSLRSGVKHTTTGGLVYFGGLIHNTLVALIGSTQHLTGYGGTPKDIEVSYSNLPTLFSYLRRDDAVMGKPQDDAADDARALHEVRDFTDALHGVRQPCRFIARRLLTGEIENPDGSRLNVLLGTPLYVALDDAE